MIRLGRNPFMDALTPKRRREVENVTVCVAAIANNGMIFAASDRMLSTDEISFEPESSKVWTVTTAISALWSGDAAIQAEILGLVQRDVQALLESEEPVDWFNVSAVVDLYVAHWGAVKRKRSTAALLSPLGLSLNDFINGHHGLSTATTDNLTNALVSYALPDTSCIIMGADHSGSHIWQIHNGVPMCSDASRFASIGAGTRHADSQMMLGRHSREKTPSETLVLVHLAKKRAEVSPSVGQETDIIWIGPSLGQHGFLPIEHMEKLDNDYEAVVEAERGAFVTAVAGFDEYLNTVLRNPAEPQDTDTE